MSMFFQPIGLQQFSIGDEFGAVKKAAKKKVVKKVVKKAAPKKLVVKTSPTSTIKRVTIEGSARMLTRIKSLETIQQWMSKVMTNDGWRVVNANFEAINYWNTSTSYDFSIYFEADVSTDYTNQQHLDSFAQTLRNYKLDYLIAEGSALVTNPQLTIKGGEGSTVAKTGATKTTKPKKASSNSNDSIGDYIDDVTGGDSSLFGLGLGISTPVVIALALGALVLIKK